MAEYTILEKEVEYIPEWNKNQEEAEPMAFTLRYLTNAERSKCQKTLFDDKGNPQIEFNNELLVKFGVSGIAHFKVNGKEITTAREFNALVGFPELHVEIATQVLVMNARQDSKN